MAMQKLYTLHDVKAQTYNPPFPAGNHALAKRMVADIAVDLNTSVGRHPSDFRLYFVGEYDDSNANFALLPIIEHVCDVVALLPQQQQIPFDMNAPQPAVNGVAR